MKTLKNIGMFLWGILAGVVLAILYAVFGGGKSKEEKDLENEINQKAEKAAEEKREEINNTSAADVVDNYLSDASKSELDRIKEESDNRIDSALGISADVVEGDVSR